ncbi:rho GTPase-activating protein 20-like [Mastomys coucha]|uniref:rho GTPase-activating protein 20-like n=1 Tax=Mastomys coucha TaxID=35658 RepID=UPI00126250D1|nr:rho GTPase-activating protein 20-like [Mastomys coucha]
MLSVISVKGQYSDQIFRLLSDRSHWSLRDRIYTQPQINWDDESVLIITSGLKDCLRNIEGSLLSSDLYENWLTILDEESLMGKISSIKSILPKMPQANYLILKQLIYVLLKIKTTTRNHLDSYVLSVRIAPHVLWDPSRRSTLFGTDLPKKMFILDIDVLANSMLHVEQ